MNEKIDRRHFLALTAASGVGLTILRAAAVNAGFATAGKQPFFQTRGVVLRPVDLSLGDWPGRVKKAGLTTIGLHAATRLGNLAAFIGTDAGQHFLESCRLLGLEVEYELHALSTFLPREIKAKNSELCRLDAIGRRNPDGNCCPNAAGALEIIAEQAVDYARRLRPTTHRYFYWPDDGGEWCSCSKCKGLSASEQAMLVENAMLRALREHHDPQATLAHILYFNTFAAPIQVKPNPGLFLEFAPMGRALYFTALSKRDYRRSPQEKSNGEMLDCLDANLAIFPRDTAQVLDYCLDVSLISHGKHPAKRLTFPHEAFLDDLKTYAQRGIRHVTSFACYIDADYMKRYGDPQSLLMMYGAGLNGRNSE